VDTLPSLKTDILVDIFVCAQKYAMTIKQLQDTFILLQHIYHIAVHLHTCTKIK